MSKQRIGVVGMAVMGRNLALNIESRGYNVLFSTVPVKNGRSDCRKSVQETGSLLYGERVC